MHGSPRAETLTVLSSHDKSTRPSQAPYSADRAPILQTNAPKQGVTDRHTRHACSSISPRHRHISARIGTGQNGRKAIRSQML